MQRNRHHIKRHCQKLAALASAACLSAVVHGLPTVIHQPILGTTMLGTKKAPSAAQIFQKKAPSVEKFSVTPERTVSMTEQATWKVATMDKQMMTLPQQATLAPLAKSATPPVKTVPETNAKRIAEIKTTGYALGSHDNDQMANKPHQITDDQPGAIAVAPQVIPPGSHVMIKYPNGHTEYAVAEDPGSPIKERRIDVAKWTKTDANRFRIQPIKMYVLKESAEKNWPGI